MTRKQRIIILSIIVLLVAYGLRVNTSKSLEFYILRNVGGENFVKDSEPFFAEADIDAYDSATKTFYLSKSFMKKMNSGVLVTHDYTNNKGDIAQMDDYFIEGISLLGARYPDQFVIVIDGEEVLKGRFQTAG